MHKLNVNIIGASGYTGGELLRILLQHPDVESINAFSRTHAGKPVWLVHGDLLGDTDLKFSDQVLEADVSFLCTGHGESKGILEKYPTLLKGRLIDLSQDFRLRGDHDFVYGLPELNKTLLKNASHVANPGCFATVIQLALLPLAKKGFLTGPVHVSATTGSTGAGQSFAESTHYSKRNNNYAAYKSFGHQHLNEIMESISGLQPSWPGELNFIPNRGSFTRGIYASVYTSVSNEQDDLVCLYEAYYSGHPFTHISSQPIDLKSVVNTNKCVMYLEKHGDKLLIHAAIDNLLKGASGQAVQNMNLMFGAPETTGLKLKAVAF